LFRFDDGKDNLNQLSTNGIENIISNYQTSDGVLVRCNFYDTNGTYRFRAVNESIYKNVDGCIIVFDITKEDTFEEIENYFIPKIKEKAKKNIPVFILGNKLDLSDSRKVSVEQGKELADENNYYYYETSANIQNINEIFEKFVEMVKHDVEKRKKSQNNNNNSIQIREEIHLGRCQRCF
jgi:small GTP-binding protein